jgi:hypothetical protein
MRWAKENQIFVAVLLPFFDWVFPARPFATARNDMRHLTDDYATGGFELGRQFAVADGTSAAASCPQQLEVSIADDISLSNALYENRVRSENRGLVVTSCAHKGSPLNQAEEQVQ